MEAVYTPSGEGVNPGVRASPGSALALSHPSSCGKVSAGKIVGQHDLSYRLFFSHRRMIQDLLREIVGERWVERLDLDSGELADPSFVSDKHDNRESDIVWRFRRKDGEPGEV